MTREISLNHLDRQLEMLLSKVDTLLHQLVVKNDPPPPLKPGHPQQQKFVTIDYFLITMLNYRSRVSYYNNLHKPGWPQRVYPAGKPMLVYDECLAYQQRLMDARKKPPLPDGGNGANGGKKRHVGRPAKLPKRFS